MPKKGKKGKGKGKKGKKGGKKGKKGDSKVAMAAANSKMWEARLDLTEKSRQEYRDNCKRLLLENDTLTNQMQQTEHDTIDVITFLKRQDQEKDGHMEKVVTQMKDIKREHRKEKEQIIEDFTQQMSDLESRLNEKTQEVQIMQSELKLVKEFRRKRGQMQRDLDQIKETMLMANKEHKDTLTRMEQKFFEEKMRLQQEANQKIAELAERAHTEAISNLDETTRSVYKENVRVTEALKYHMEEGEKLQKLREKLEQENQHLMGDKELNDMMIQDKVSETKHHKKQIKELQEKVQTLEKSLSHVIREFETEREFLRESAKIETEASRVEICKLQRLVDLRTKEMNKVKRLARNILDQRTEMERFFLEALEQVKMEIAATQIQYRKDAQLAYQQKMLAAHVGRGDFPKIRTFNKSTHSTNNVFHDLEAAERLIDISGKVDISDITWEQKERVLRFLFAKMNGAKGKSLRQTSSAQAAMHHAEVPMILDRQSLPPEDTTEDDNTFLTQAKVEDEHSLPNIPKVNNLIAAEST